MPEGWIESFDNILELLGEDFEMLMENTIFRLYKRWQTKRKFRQLVDLDYSRVNKINSEMDFPISVFSNNTKDILTLKR